MRPEIPSTEIFAPLIVGGSGFIGRQLLALGGPRALGTYRGHAFPGAVPFDAVHDRLEHVLDRAGSRFSHAILLFGISAGDACAADEAGTRKINVDAMIQAIEDCQARGVTPVHISTDYVFDGSRGSWRETDRPAPITAYGRQKHEVECHLLAQTTPFLIIRLSKVVDFSLGRHNPLGEWATQIMNGSPIRCAYDQAFSPLHVEDTAAAILRLAAERETGIWHVAGQPFTRLALLETLATAIRAVDSTLPLRIEPCLLHDLPFRERRPLDTSLSTEKLSRRIPFDPLSMSTVCREIATRYFDRQAATAG
jgi:dTDP-4-dehydrorhamnose reductase